MKICVPTEDKNGLEAQVSGHFGRAPYFALVDSETKAVEFVVNGETGHEHGRCVGAALAVEMKPEVVLTAGMGRGAFDLVRSGGARVFRTEGLNLSDALEGFTQGNAPELVSSEAAGHHHAGQEAHGHGGGCCGGHDGHEHHHMGHGRV
ncbi:MAG TPA: NifB/NifX family molybdenum-iron cluster-binding protein [Spirochaetia bacterium]|nr:NifB/NifX family molybdenum-iron cluster-binding protein [Spirochaetia bacterium]